MLKPNQTYPKISNPNTPIEFQRLKRSSYKAQLSAASCLVAAHGAPISFEPKSDGREPIAGSQHPSEMLSRLQFLWRIIIIHNIQGLWNSVFFFVLRLYTVKKIYKYYQMKMGCMEFSPPKFYIIKCSTFDALLQTGCIRFPEGTKHQIW